MKFNEIQKIINGFVNGVKKHNYKFDENVKLQTSDALFCAEDVIRNQKFWLGIEKVLSKNKFSDQKFVVVDAGAGIGVLGVFALILGADKCYFIEQNPHTFLLMNQFVSNLGLLHKSEFVLGDAIKTVLPESYDLLISETISSGFVDEDFLKILENLKQFAKDSFEIVPKSFDLDVKDTLGNTIFSKRLLSKNLCQNIKFKVGGDVSDVVFCMNAEIFDDVEIVCGSCMSFLNPRVFSLQEKHPIFVIDKGFEN